ncbi:DUF134 domain-containing protein [uncultured Desulfovibrio sp.]|uniref:DUF134 domain-containing protein n=1 Tax=uncultured Desulfovibrio sp. TaxID=167968 RepID=UPI00262C31CF|nr:DUF134 domain-containing protein [uncultured Desulfovibrio sp.]
MRPQKLRTITAEPCCRRFFPETGGKAPAMSLGLDMLEALRLADAEGLPQEEAARHMEISPPTFCRLLAEARRRVALALTEGLPLVMEGGNVRLRSAGERNGQACRGRHGHGGRRDAQTPLTEPAQGQDRDVPGGPPHGGHGCGRGRRQRMRP